MLKFFLRIVVLFGITVAFYSIPDNFLTLDLFDVKKVNIVGDTKISLRELTEMGEITYNKSIWNIDFKFIEDKIKQDIRIKDAKVQADSIGELTIRVIEREPFCYAQINGNIFLMDDEGNIFGFFNEKSKKDMPLVILENKNQISELLDILKNIDMSTLGESISQIYEKDKNCIEMILTDGVIIKTNNDVDKEKYTILEYLYSELHKESRIEYIDLRFDDFIVKKVGG